MEHQPSRQQSGPVSDPGPEQETEQTGDPPTRARFLPRLDYYLKLAEGPGLPDEVTADTEQGSGHLSGDVAQEDTAMIDPELANVTGNGTRSPTTETPQSSRGPHGISEAVPSKVYNQPGPYMFLSMRQPSSGQWNFYPGASQHSLRQEFLFGPDAQLEKHLTECFFEWDNVFVDAFNQNLYLREKARYEQGRDVLLYSPALQYAVMAVGSLYSEESNSSDADYAEQFGSRAKELLHAELNTPRMSTVLTLIVLCSLAATNAEDTEGWLYSGMATRLIPNVKPDPNALLSYPSENGATVKALHESIVRGVMALDTMWSIWTGKPVDRNYWGARVSVVSGPEEGGVETDAHVARLTKWMLYLRILMRSSLSSDPSPVHLEWLSKDFDEWKISLPEMERSTAPSRVLALDTQLLMHCYCARIHLHREHTRSQTGQTCNWEDEAADPCETCADSARNIIRMQKTFEEVIGLQKLQPFSVCPMLSACLTEILNSGSQAKQNKQKRQAIWRSTQAFVEIAETRDAGSRALEIIMAAQRKWQSR